MDAKQYLERLLHYLNLESERDDFNIIHQTIEKDIIFKGTNLWILVFAIIVASVGLNMNSTAVIIGAMLISPLMGPINGMGYSIATYDYDLFRKAIKNLFFAVVASLLASTAYFMVSPISTAHSELLARTSPTIYDVLIAFFGGMAGIVAISSKHKGNVIPGVAIATALMPPLCTAGYGLATAQFYYFFGALYLFTINTVFIGISSVVVSQILKFPIRTLVDVEKKRRINRYISIVIALVFIPSVYFGYILVQKERFLENANKYVRNISIFEGNYLLRNEIDPDRRTIKLVFGGSTISESQKTILLEKLADFSLEKTKIEFQQGLSFDEFAKRRTDIDRLTSELNQLNLIIADKDKQIDSIYQRNFIGRQVLDEIRTLYPQINTCSFAETYVFFEEKKDYEKISYLVIGVDDESLSNENKKKVEDWLKVRLKISNLKVIYEERK